MPGFRLSLDRITTVWIRRTLVSFLLASFTQWMYMKRAYGGNALKLSSADFLVFSASSRSAGGLTGPLVVEYAFSQRPSDLASCTVLNPAGVILSSSSSRSTRRLLLMDHLLLLLRGEKRCMNSSWLRRFILPSIHPWATASSTASSYRKPGRVDDFFCKIIQREVSSWWFWLSQPRHSWTDAKYLGLSSDNSVKSKGSG